MLSTFVQGLVDQDSCPYYELSFNDFKITTIGQSGLRGAIEILRRVGILPPPPLTDPPLLLPSSKPATLDPSLAERPATPIEPSAEDIIPCAPSNSPAISTVPSFDASTAAPMVDIRTAVLTSQVGQDANTQEHSSNQFQMLASVIHSALQETEARIEARVDKLIVATQVDGDRLFTEAKKDFMEAGNYKHRNAKTHREYEFFFDFFVDVVGNKKLSEYRYSDANRYTEVNRPGI